MKVRAIIFDCFGVLTSDGWLALRDSVFANDPDALEQARYLNKQVDAGALSYDNFIQCIADLAHMTASQVRQEIENNRPNRALFEYIRDELKPNYKIGLLSNAGANWLSDLFEPWQVALFDEVALSFETGVIKPNPLAYEAIATKLGMIPEECVFIDDQPAFVTGAKEVDMKAIHFVDNDRFKETLQNILRSLD